MNENTMMVTAYGVPPSDGPRDALPVVVTPMIGEAPEALRPYSEMLRKIGAIFTDKSEHGETLKRVAASLAALRIAPEVVREDHRAMLDQCIGELRRVADALEAGR